jgi:hypothetical protein
MDRIDADDLKTLALRLAALGERLDQRSEVASRRVEQAAAVLDRGAQQFSASTAGFTRDVAHSLRQQAGEIVGSGIGAAAGAFDQQVRAAAKSVSAATRALETEVQALRRERRTWAWMGGGSMLVAGLLAVGASLFAVTEGRKQLAQQRIEAELLRAYNRADVTLCDGALCANVDDAGPRRGDRKQYRPVRLRGEAE